MWEMAGRIVKAYHATLTKDGRGQAEMDSEEGTNAGHLNDYWAHGEGAGKIAWGTDGDFDRCRAQLGKYIHDPAVLAGHCANLHHKATGAWPGHAVGEQKGAQADLQKDWAEWDAAHEGKRIRPNTRIGKKDKATGERTVHESRSGRAMGTIRKTGMGKWETKSAHTGAVKTHSGKQAALDHLSTDFIAHFKTLSPGLQKDWAEWDATHEHGHVSSSRRAQIDTEDRLRSNPTSMYVRNKKGKNLGRVHYNDAAKSWSAHHFDKNGNTSQTTQHGSAAEAQQAIYDSHNEQNNAKPNAALPAAYGTAPVQAGSVPDMTKGWTEALHPRGFGGKFISAGEVKNGDMIHHGKWGRVQVTSARKVQSDGTRLLVVQDGSGKLHSARVHQSHQIFKHDGTKEMDAKYGTNYTKKPAGKKPAAAGKKPAADAQKPTDKKPIKLPTKKPTIKPSQRGTMEQHGLGHVDAAKKRIMMADQYGLKQDVRDLKIVDNANNYHVKRPISGYGQSDYKVGDTIHRDISGVPSTVLVTDKSDDIKNGYGGFEGVVITGPPDRVGGGIWGYDSQINDVFTDTPAH